MYTLLIIILIINYALAAYAVKHIIDDNFWSEFLLFLSTEEDEQSKLIIENQLFVRQLFLTMMFVPFAALVVAIALIKSNTKTKK